MNNLSILSGNEIKELKDIPIDKRKNILIKKQSKFLEIAKILFSIINRTDEKATKLKERYYNTLYYIYEDVNKIKISLTAEYQKIIELEEFLNFEKSNRELFSCLSLYRENRNLNDFNKVLILSVLKKMPQKEIIKFLREVFLDKRLGFRKYNNLKR